MSRITKKHCSDLQIKKKLLRIRSVIQYHLFQNKSINISFTAGIHFEVLSEKWRIFVLVKIIYIIWIFEFIWMWYLIIILYFDFSIFQYFLIFLIFLVIYFYIFIFKTFFVFFFCFFAIFFVFSFISASGTGQGVWATGESRRSFWSGRTGTVGTCLLSP